MSGFLSASPTWKPGTPIERWPYQIPGSTARLAALQDKLRSWQRWPSVAEPSDPVALLDQLPGFQLAWLSGVRDVPVLLGLVLSELAARRLIRIDETWRVSPGPVALRAESPAAFACVLATLSASDSAPPTVERLARRVIRDAEGRALWRERLVRDPLLGLGLLVMPEKPDPGSTGRAQVAAILTSIGERTGVPTQAGKLLVDAVSQRAEDLATASTSAQPPDAAGLSILHHADALGSALICFPELWAPVQQAAADSAGHGSRPTGLFLTDLTEVMLSHEVGGALWT